MSSNENAVLGTGTHAEETNHSTRETEPPENPVELEEHDESIPFYLSRTDLEFIDRLGSNSTPLTVNHTSGETASLSTSSFVGVATLPSGTRIEVTPKRTVSRLLDLLQYAFDVPVNTVEQTTHIEEADMFIDAFGSLFSTELREVLQNGIRRDYKRTREIKPSVRGRLDVQRQIQRPTPVPTDFAVEYDTFTPNTTLNQAVLSATQILTALVSDASIAGELSRQEKQLRQFVSPEPVTVAELETVELTRLNAYYKDLLELCKIVLSRRFFDDLTTGHQASLGLFINMNTIFESVVERAFREAAENVNSEWSAQGQGKIDNLINGPHSVNMTPDFVVKNESGAILVGDAKWKTGSERSSDIYQITSYMMADQAPGFLVYPEQDREKTTSTISKEGEDLEISSIYLPTAADVDSYQDYTAKLVQAAESHLRSTVTVTDR